jgi:hypothetical protein
MTSEGKLESSPPYSFEISHMSAKKTKVVDFDAQYSPYDAKVYGLRTAFHGKDDTDKPDPRDMIPYSSAMVMVDAAVHCSDRASHRKAVHDPDAEGPLLHEASFLRKTNTKYPGYSVMMTESFGKMRLMGCARERRQERRREWWMASRMRRRRGRHGIKHPYCRNARDPNG